MTRKDYVDKAFRNSTKLDQGQHQALSHLAVALATPEPSRDELIRTLSNLVDACSKNDMLPESERWYYAELFAAVNLLARMDGGK